MIKIMMFWRKILLRKVGFKNTCLPLVQNDIHDSLVKLNGTRHTYELRRSDGGPKYEIWLWVMKSYIELHLILLESYRVRRLLDIPNNFRVIRNKCEHQRRHQDWFVEKNVSDKFNRLTTICSNAWVNGIFTTIDPKCY